MVMEIDLFKVVLMGLAVLVTAVLVPVLMQLRRTLLLLEHTLGEAREELLPLLRNLRETSERLNRASAGVEAGVDELHGLFAAIGAVRKGVQGLADTLQHGFSRILGQILGLWCGMRAAHAADAEEEPKGD